MKHIIISLLFLVATAQMLSQDTSKVTVTGAEVNNGVVIINVLEGKTRVELQCNANMPNCKKLSPGSSYTMVRLPKGHGMYECDNVDMISGDAQSGEKVGQYCAVKS